MDDVDDLQRCDANDGGRDKGADRLRQSELEHDDVADEHGDNAFEGDDGEQLLRRVEHDGEAARSKDCRDRLIEIGVCRLDVHIGDVVNPCNEDGKGDAERHAADDEHGVHCARHAGGGEAVQRVTCRIDGWEAGHEKDGAGNECVPHDRKTKCGGDDPRRDRRNKARNHGTSIGIECVLCAHTVSNKSHKSRDGGDERLKPASTEELA